MSLAFDIGAFLEEERRLAQVASVSPGGLPLLGSLWFAYTQGRFWFSSLAGSPFPSAAAEGRPVAVLVDDFDPPRAIRQVRVRGHARIEPHDAGLVQLVYRRYLGADQATWPQSFQARVDDACRWVLWSVRPDTGLAVTSPGFVAEEQRWKRLEDCPLPHPTQRSITGWNW